VIIDIDVITDAPISRDGWSFEVLTSEDGYAWGNIQSTPISVYGRNAVIPNTALIGKTTATGDYKLEVEGDIKSSDNVSAKKLMADSARIDDTLWVGTTNATKLYDGWYLEGNYLCTLSGFTSTVTCTTYYVKCGKAVTLTFSRAAGTSNDYDIRISTGLMPASIRPTRQMYWVLSSWSFDGLQPTTEPDFYYTIPNNVFRIISFQPEGPKSIKYSF